LLLMKRGFLLFQILDAPCISFRLMPFLLLSVLGSSINPKRSVFTCYPSVSPHVWKAAFSLASLEQYGNWRLPSPPINLLSFLLQGPKLNYPALILVFFLPDYNACVSVLLFFLLSLRGAFQRGFFLFVFHLDLPCGFSRFSLRQCGTA